MRGAVGVRAEVELSAGVRVTVRVRDAVGLEAIIGMRLGYCG